jgi:beta-mannanase
MKLPALLCLVVALLASQALSEERSTDDHARPWPATRAAHDAPDIGVVTGSLARSATLPWTTADLREVNGFEQHARQHTDVVMWFADWAHSDARRRQLDAVSRRGSTPEITWEPWDSTLGPRKRQPRFSLASIIAGRHDSYVRSWASVLRSFGKTVRLRFAQEMNGNWYPWSEATNGNRPGQYVAAWRHVHDIFEDEGAANVEWVWSPVGGGLRLDQYPGDRYVDIIGMSGFNGGTRLFRRHWRAFSDIYGGPLSALHAAIPDKPVEISEVASTEAGGSKAAWISAMFNDLAKRPYVKALIWFDVVKEADWRIESSAGAQRAFADGARRLRLRAREPGERSAE